jgi:hypothetical protein
MNESMLQREFRNRDVQRMRNIITKDYTAKTVTQIGYNKIQIEYNEGDIWEENGKQWTIKNGIKQTITRFDKLKKSITLPIICPKCSNSMKTTLLNRKMWPIHGTCFDCVIKMETELKRQGKFEEYTRNLVNKGVQTHIKEIEDLILEVALEDNNEEFITEQGDIEKWAGKGIDKQKITQELQEYVVKLKNHISS